MLNVPEHGVFPALPGEVGTNPARAPLERMVVDKLARFGVFTIPLGLGKDRANHLRVAVVTALGHVNVAPRQFQRSVRLDRGNRRDVGTNQESRNDLKRRGYQHGDGDPDGEANRHPLPDPVPAGLQPDVEPLPCIEDSIDSRRGGRCVSVLRAQRSRLINGNLVGPGAREPGHQVVVSHQQGASEKERAADDSGPPHWLDGIDRLDKLRIDEVSLAVESPPHQPLGQASHVDRHNVEQDADRSQPEMPSRQFGAEQFGLENSGKQPVEHAEGHEAVPAECTGVNMCDGPVGVMRQGIDAFDRKHRAFERCHPVKGDPDHEELEHRVSGDFVPSPAEGQQTVDHSAPGGHPEHQRENHPQRRSPGWRGRIVQVVRTSPNIDEHQRPEVNDAQLVGEHRALRGLWQKVIHQAEKRCRKKKSNCVVAVPPLHEGVLHPRVYGIAFEDPRRNNQIVEDVQNRHRHNGGDVEP